jgi:hypothetical protein
VGSEPGMYKPVTGCLMAILRRHSGTRRLRSSTSVPISDVRALFHAHAIPPAADLAPQIGHNPSQLTASALGSVCLPRFQNSSGDETMSHLALSCPRELTP